MSVEWINRRTRRIAIRAAAEQPRSAIRSREEHRTEGQTDDERATVTAKNAFDHGESSRVSCIPQQGMTRAPAPKISGPVRFVIAVAEEKRTIGGDLLGAAPTSSAGQPSVGGDPGLSRA